MKGAILFLVTALALSSCSFKYSEVNEAIAPDMVFTGVTALRYSDGKKNFEIGADIMEVYSSEKIWAAEEVTFAEFSEDDAEENSASAGIMILDDKSEVYTLGNSVSFYVGEDEIAIKGEDLRWDKRKHFISAPAESAVEIIGKNISASGTGFFANTQDRSYSFSGRISGRLMPDNDEEPDKDEEDDESGAGEVMRE